MYFKIKASFLLMPNNHDYENVENLHTLYTSKKMKNDYAGYMVFSILLMDLIGQIS